MGLLAEKRFEIAAAMHYRILGTVQPSRLDGLPHKRFLIGRQMDFHESSVRAGNLWVKQ
jgi:hypothetical protein